MTVSMTFSVASSKATSFCSSSMRTSSYFVFPPLLRTITPYKSARAQREPIIESIMCVVSFFQEPTYSIMDSKGKSIFIYYINSLYSIRHFILFYALLDAR